MPTVSKNIYWSTLASLLQLYTGSIVFILLAKMMTVEDFGILSFGFSLSAIVVIMADFGFSLMIMKDFPAQTVYHSYLSSSVLAKIILAIGSALVFAVYLFFFYEGKWLIVGVLYIAFALIASFTIYFQALLRVQNKFDKYTESGVVFAIAVTILVLTYWYVRLDLVTLVFCLLACKLVQMIWTIVRCKDSFIKFEPKTKKAVRLLKNSWSFGLFGVLGILYFMVDTQIISLYHGAREVALYQSVFRIIFILLVMTDIVSNVLLPYLSFKMHKKEDISELTSKIFLFMLIIGCSLFLVLTTFKSEILSLVYTPEYEEAGILMLPLSIVVIERAVSSFLGNILTVSNKQVYRVITVAVSLAVSLTLNFALIPVYGILAAAWVSVLVHLVLFSMYSIYSKKEVSSMRLISLSSASVVLVTIIIYFIINHLTDGKMWIVISCVLFWLFLIVLIMRRDNNLGFLQIVLREKGSG